MIIWAFLRRLCVGLQHFEVRVKVEAPKAVEPAFNTVRVDTVGSVNLFYVRLGCVSMHLLMFHLLNNND